MCDLELIITLRYMMCDLELIITLRYMMCDLEYMLHWDTWCVTLRICYIEIHDVWPWVYVTLWYMMYDLELIITLRYMMYDLELILTLSYMMCDLEYILHCVTWCVLYSNNVCHRERPIFLSPDKWTVGNKIKLKIHLFYQHKDRNKKEEEIWAPLLTDIW